ncbi:hypothetical protein DPX16_19875 [Anabarilius grahami]|uniref:Uncharacterized protein n=1 Tax=Anabarilius grahami TaxID=495550 RepID=A0A3N0Y739_ANAGA|nr:hypothetical protein DPX16_19875 [Anabarilius grahami]
MDVAVVVYDPMGTNCCSKCDVWRFTKHTKMAPMSVACRPLSVLLMFLLTLLFLYSHSLIVFDRQQLIDIYRSMPKPLGFHPDLNSYEFYSSPTQPSSLDYLRWCTFGVPCKKRRRKRGKRGGAAVRLKLAWASGSTSTLLQASAPSNLVCRSWVFRGTAERGCPWICLIVPHSPPTTTQRIPLRIR